MDQAVKRHYGCGLASGSFDLLVSNCMVNLVRDRARHLCEAHRRLRPGGETYFADIGADRRIPARLVADDALRCGCLAGALYWNDFVTFAKGSGFADPAAGEGPRPGGVLRGLRPGGPLPGHTEASAPTGWPSTAPTPSRRASWSRSAG